MKNGNATKKPRVDEEDTESSKETVSPQTVPDQPSSAQTQDQKVSSAAATETQQNTGNYYNYNVNPNLNSTTPSSSSWPPSSIVSYGSYDQASYVPPPAAADQQYTTDGANYLFQSFPESLPDEFGNVDVASQTASNLDYNVSGNYAWLFGREFWSDVYPKGASYAYELLTDGGNNVVQSAADGTNMTANVLPPESNVQPLIATAAPNPPQEQVQSSEMEAPVNTTNDTNNNNNVRPSLSDGSYKIDSSQGPSQLPFIRPDYLGSRVGMNANLLYEYTVKSQRLQGNRNSTVPNTNDVKIGPRYPLDKSVMNSTQTVYTKDRHGSHKSGGIGQHVFGKTYGQFTRPKNALVADHVFIDDKTQSRIMAVMKDVPNVDPNSPYFAPESLSRYLDLYWSNFDPLYPMIHKPTFKATETCAELLICMIIVGMAYSNDSGSYDLAVTILQKVRIAILAMIGSKPDVPIWVLQGLLLLNYFVNVFGSRNLIEMSQVFHGTHIALLRLTGYLSDLVIPEIPEDYNAIDIDAFWNYYIDFETKKRTTFFAFICDTQQAVFYRHTLGLSGFEVHLELPCSDACWEAATSQRFIEIYRIQPRHLQPRPYPDIEEMFNPSTYSREDSNEDEKKKSEENSDDATATSKKDKDADNDPLMEDLPIKTQGNWPTFLFSIRRLMSPYHENQYEYALECFSPYSRFILLHGLLNISWEMQWRGFLDMGIVSKRRMHEFKTRIVVAFTSWKGYFDRQLRRLNTPELNRIVAGGVSSSSSSASSPRPDHDDIRPTIELNSYSNTLTLCSNWGLYHYGLIVLYVDTLMIQRYAELPRNIDEPDAQLAIEQLKAKQYVNRWVSTLDAKWASWHSMHFLQLIFTNELLIHQADNLPWCTFTSILTLWAYDRDKDGHQQHTKTISSKAYFEYSSPSSQQTSFLNINQQIAQKDALEYLELVKNSPPKTLSGSSPQDEPTPSDPAKRSQLVISVIAYGYLLLQRFDRSNGNYIRTLQAILERYQ